MDYSELAEVYEKLEKTPAKLEKTHIIAEILKKTEARELSMLVLLLCGRVFPAWSEFKLGVANQLMIKALARAYGPKETEINQKFTELGDLGLVAEEFARKRKQVTLLRKKLQLEDVFRNLQEIAKQTGPGSQDRKLALIAELLARAEPKEARYIVRTVLEELRVGVAEGIVRDAIASAFGIPAEEVEAAWSVRPDYSEIARIAKEEGERGLKKLKLQPGIPFQVLLAEKAPSLEDALKAFKRPVLEFKYDGARTLIHKKGDKIWIYTRRLEDVTSAFPDLVELAKKCIKAKEAILDSETIGINPKTGRPYPFQMLSTRIKRKYEIERMMKEIPIQTNLFDIVYLEGKCLFNLKLSERRKLLKQVVKVIPGKFQLAESLEEPELKKAEAFYKKALDAGHEGLIVKNLDAKYVPGRRVAGGWLKVKPTLENLDLVIIGATWGTGKRAGWLGSFILGCRDPDTGRFLECGMLGTGIKEKKTSPEDVTFADMTEMLKPYIERGKDGRVFIKPKIVIEVAYEEIQKSPEYSSGFALRFPRFVRLRPDKDPEEADTLERVKKLYELQRGRGQA
ncbi:MAG: DNA ligase [Candidatus Aenigmatarchaeota archaeon]|nr:MAG: DNA ligase [Candidatus Aenigmarchaeota archaeon]